MEHNTICSRYCIDVIRAVMQEKPIPKIPDEVSLQELFSFSKMHSVEALVYHGLSELNMDETDPVWRYWGNRAEMLLTQSIVQLTERDILFDALTHVGVDLIPVKGCWLKEAYPQIDYRQMSDLDILIHKEDQDIASKVMSELGYEKEPSTLASNHDGFKKEPYTAVELHLQLLPHNSRHGDYYNDIWKAVKQADGSPRLYRLSAEDEYIFYFLHLEKHIEEGGSGIRSILDCMVFRNTHPNMNQSYLQNEFEKLKIHSFVQMIEQLADCWFVTGDSVPAFITELANIILTSGVYGHVDNLFRNRLDALKKKYKNPILLMIVYWAPRFFRPLEDMQTVYPILTKLPVLLPAFWIIHISKKLVTRPSALLYHVKQVFKEGFKNGKH